MPAPTLTLDSTLATTILNAQTITGAGSGYTVPTRGVGHGRPSILSWQINITGGPTAVATTLQGSNDGLTWYTLDTSTNVSGELRAIANVAVTFIRGNVTTLTGGVSPTVSILVQLGA